jgi:hypothetical protein
VASHKETHVLDPKLIAAGFDPAAAPADAVNKLGELRTANSADDIAIAHALGGIADAAAAAMLAEMERSATGAPRREVRRALYRLHQRGIEPPAAAPRAKPARQTDAGVTALISPVDREGVRIVWLVRSRMNGRIARLFALDSRDEGLLAAENAELSRREFKSEREQLELRVGTKLIDLDWHLADFIICDAYRRTPEGRRGRVGNFMALRAELIPSAPAADLKHPVYDEFATEAQREPSPDLLREPEFTQWRLPEAVVKQYADEISRAGESVIVVSPIQQRERLNETIERALVTMLEGESGARIRRGLEDLAYFMARDGRRPQAGWAVAAAARIRDGADLKHNAFFQAWIRTQLGAVFAQEQERAAEEPRLIMTPAEAMRAQQQRSRR